MMLLIYYYYYYYYYYIIEAIKFGDPLSVKDCTLLIKALQDTKAPTRCAHGRPSVIPILDMTNVDARKSSDGVSIIIIALISLLLYLQHL